MHENYIYDFVINRSSRQFTSRGKSQDMDFFSKGMQSLKELKRQLDTDYHL